MCVQALIQGCLLQNCHIDVKEDQLAKLMVAEGFVHGAEVIMRAETFKRCLLHVSAFFCRVE